jgi:hypothetical protein
MESNADERDCQELHISLDEKAFPGTQSENGEVRGCKPFSVGGRLLWFALGKSGVERGE